MSVISAAIGFKKISKFLKRALKMMEISEKSPLLPSPPPRVYLSNSLKVILLFFSLAPIAFYFSPTIAVPFENISWWVFYPTGEDKA